MKRIILATLLGAISFLPAKAQFKEIASSEKFDEPQKGFLKIINNEKGETFYLRIDPKEGLEVKKFGVDHKLMLEKTLPCTYGKLTNGDLLSVFETNNTIAIFTSEMDDQSCLLYRQILDEDKCEFKEETIIDSMPKAEKKVKLGFTIKKQVYRKVEFHVNKDPNSNCYAVAGYNSDEPMGQRIVIKHFNAQHALISSAPFVIPVTNYEDYDFKDMAVHGDKEVVALIVAIDASVKKSKYIVYNVGKLYAGTLKAGTPGFEYHKVDNAGSEVNEINRATIKYNPVTEQYLILSTKEMAIGKRISFLSYKSVFDPKVNTITTDLVTSNMVSKTATNNMVRPIALQILMNHDGTYSIAFEDATYKVEDYTNVPRSGGGYGDIRFILQMQSFAIVDYDSRGDIVNSRIIPKAVLVPYFNNLYDDYEVENGIMLANASAYSHYFLLNRKNKKYILFNDDETNQERVENDGDLKTIWGGMENCLSYCMDINQNVPKPFRKLIFDGEDVNRKNRSIAMFNAAVYDEKKDELVTVKLNYKTKEVNLVWLKPEL